MALRRPPTRIELKTEDMSEYEELKQRQRAALQPDPPDATPTAASSDNKFSTSTPSS
eukprot:CAMPEP_0119017272 /NCGR_PEP_ID=MMETSP1176-20130426/15987_1 /TAXON_ID=265551 /ORGANISM="Synedropsis recta cf, Strain CCMP1620" /LENGTH=56 /DNA_ID=CAMNT_0006970947 /DNA_START=37 /DNA_END=203 /DNA_ORIENTATION=-